MTHLIFAMMMVGTLPMQPVGSVVTIACDSKPNCAGGTATPSSPPPGPIGNTASAPAHSAPSAPHTGNQAH